ncbi:MAG TPA: hypothetical protein EYQ22_08160 [Gammaproteobacteria bacterium]|nr:hypothetical protein [Gammaproteobacteria bacterium]HIK69374.1 hypothetical protein [Pseudomonadales bacterium]
MNRVIILGSSLLLIVVFLVSCSSNAILSTSLSSDVAVDDQADVSPTNVSPTNTSLTKVLERSEVFGVAEGMAGSNKNDELSLALERMLSDLKKAVDESVSTGEISQIDEDGYYLVKRGDSLSRIIERVIAKTNINGEFLKKAFVAANPKAFKRANPNWLYANSKLRLPLEKDFRKLVFKRENKNSEKNDEMTDPYKDWIQYPWVVP